MGQCCASSESVDSPSDVAKVHVALKLPHGLAGMKYDTSSQTFEPCHIHVWLSNLYKNATWRHWIAYNDQNYENRVKKGHCKGLLAWNDTHVSWLCHSVPYFPRSFTGTTISDIDVSEQLYGQSFHYYECPITPTLLRAIFHQLFTMEACPVFEHYTGTTMTWEMEKCNFQSMAFSKLVLTDTLVHMAKSPKAEVDIYSQYVAICYPALWKVETWIRGHTITTPCPLIQDCDTLAYKNIAYKESQDHSKWAVSDKDWYWVGDLNRMTSQFHRGGGGFVGTDAGLARAFRSLIKTIKNGSPRTSTSI